MNDHQAHDSMPEEFTEDAVRLTAHALGEGDDAERRAIAARLDADPEAQAEVAEIRAAADRLAVAFAAEPAPRLTDQQRRTIDAGPRPDRSGGWVRAHRLWIGVSLAAAACLAGAVILPNLGRARSNVAIGEAGPAESVREQDRRDRAVPGADGGRGERSTDSLGIAPTEAPGRERAAGSELAFGGAPELDLNTVLRQAAPPTSGFVGVMTSEGVDPSASSSYHWTSPAATPRPNAATPPPPASAAPPGGAAGAVADELRRASTTATPDATIESERKADDVPRERLRGLATREPGIGGGDVFPPLVENGFVAPVGERALSTFAIDVDSASYAWVRSSIESGAWPSPDSVRLEELVNFFDYAYEPASGDDPYGVDAVVTQCPWNEGSRLLRVALQAREIPADMRPATNLVFLVDVSGSMNDAAKLPLVQAGLRMLVERLLPDDRLAIVVYAGASGLVLPPTWCDAEGRAAALEAIDRMRAGGSTNGGQGIALAYATARSVFIEGGENRVVLCTDGDFNVGVSGVEELGRLAAGQRESGVRLTVLGFGRGNWQDAKMQALAQQGDGFAAYVDSLEEARRLLVDRLSGTLVTVAKDAKIQVAFNPARVASYRLLGYATRLLEARDFRDDAKDAGEIGAGHAVTALYEIVPGRCAVEAGDPDAPDLVFQRDRGTELVESDLLARVMTRWKRPDAGTADPAEERAVDVPDVEPAPPTGEVRFAAAVAAFAMVLRDSPHRGSADLDLVLDLAAPESAPATLRAKSIDPVAAGEDAPPAEGSPEARAARRAAERAQFRALVERAKALRE